MPAGKPDITAFRNDGLKAKIPNGKRAVADCGYRGNLQNAAFQIAKTQQKFVTSKVVLVLVTKASTLDSKITAA